MYSHTKNGERILWCLLEADAQDIAEARIKRKLTKMELVLVRKGLESGLGECWHDVMATSIDLAVEQSKQIEYERKMRIVENLLQEGIKAHRQGKCRCDLTEGGQGLCYAGQWLENIISSEQVIKDLSSEGEEKNAKRFSKS